MNEVVKCGIAFEESIMMLSYLYCLDKNKKLYVSKNVYNYSHFDNYVPDCIFNNMPTKEKVKGNDNIIIDIEKKGELGTSESNYYNNDFVEYWNCYIVNKGA